MCDYWRLNGECAPPDNVLLLELSAISCSHYITSDDWGIVPYGPIGGIVPYVPWLDVSVEIKYQI